MDKRMKGFTCCGDCIHYNYKKHKCNLGASVETDARNHFYDDCPIPDIPSEQEIRAKAISNFADWCYINGVDFSYMSTSDKSGRQFIDDVIARYHKEQMKEDRENEYNSK